MATATEIQRDEASAQAGGTRAARLWTPERVPLTVPLAGIGERALAYGVDLVLIVVFGVSALFVYNFWGDIERDLSALSGTALLFLLLGVLLLLVLWDVGFEVWGKGATPGKRLLKLRVVTAAGDTPDLLTSFMRNVLRLLDFLPSFYGFGAVAMFFTGTQRLGDLVAGTWVVSERARGQDPIALARRYAGEAGPDDALPAWTDEQTTFVLRVLEASEDLDQRRADARLEAALARLDDDERAERADAEGGRRTVARAILALAGARQGRCAELARIADAEAALARALAVLDEDATAADAERADDAIRHAGSALMRAERKGVPGRRQEALSLCLLEAERLRRLRPSPGGLLTKLLKDEVPAAIYAERAQVLRAGAVLFGAAGLGFAMAYADETVGRALLGDELAAMVNRGASWTDQIEERGSFAQAALQIIANNVRVGMLAFAAGLLGGVGTLLLLTLNGLHLGSVFGFAANLGTAGTLGKFILAHGPVELSAIAVAGGAGLCVGRAIIRPGARSRRDALRVEGARGVRLLVGATLGFLIIGGIEGFVSPGALFPWPVNAAVGVGMWLLFFFWIRLRGRAASAALAAARPTGARPS